MKRFIVTKFITLLSANLLLFSATLGAQTVELESATEHPNGRPDTERRYVATSPQHPQFKFAFTASRYGFDGTWFLQITPVVDSCHGERPVFGRDEILGADGLLFTCINRFLADVPDARVTTVGFDAGMSGPLWSGVQEKLAPLLKKWRGKVWMEWGGDEYSKYKKVQDTVEATLRQSSQLNEVAERVAVKLNQPLIRIDVSAGESGTVGYCPNTENKTWPELLELPNYGIALETICVDVWLKPKRVQRKST